MTDQTHARPLPAELGAPSFVDGWRRRALVTGLAFSIMSFGLAVADKSVDHVLRAWLLGMVLTFGFAVGGLALLMVEHVTWRQVGTSAAQTFGGYESHTSTCFRLLAGGCAFSEKTIFVGPH